jgi:hypothetical protein
VLIIMMSETGEGGATWTPIRQDLTRVQHAGHKAITNVHRGFNLTLQLTPRLLKTDETPSTVRAQAHAVYNGLSKLHFHDVLKN